MLRAPLAILAVASLVAALAFLIIESRSVTNDDYVAHAARARAIEASASDIAAVRSGIRTSLQEGNALPLAVELSLSRLKDNNRLLQGLADVPPLPAELGPELARYDDALRRFVEGAEAFAVSQTALAESLATVQRESPRLVRELQDQQLVDQSDQLFTLAIDVIESVTGQGVLDATGLMARIEALRDDPVIDEQMPGGMVAFVTAASGAIAGRDAAESTLRQMQSSMVDADLTMLEAAVVTVNNQSVNRAERAQVLLALCSVLILITAGVAVSRLQSSYGELNRSNAELERTNESLEQRVEARTEELSRAYEELKQSQVQLVHAEKMSSLGQMVAGISHEINTPLWYLMSNSSTIGQRLDVVSQLCDIAQGMLNAVKSGTNAKQTVAQGLREMNQLLNGGIKDDIDEARDLTQDNIEGLDELTALAQGLKDFSRLDTADKQEFDVNEGLEKSLLIAKNRIKNKATVHKYYGDVPLVWCSPSQINQIFLNLLTNAADAIEEQGDIVVHTWERDGNVEMSVSDTGVGIPADVLPRIRDPFFTTKDVGHGTGLGLSIVDRIVADHGGELRVESEAGRGTTVTVSLRIRADDRPDVVHSVPARPGEPIEVLSSTLEISDDRESTRTVR